ncbi:hypothetical protein DSO57_1031535 [Entomophthora muscae]|uniref:Uncharacterized protein n=1 Tax=Entomophthora muscae TaxID=34485 RepID=A0ACC2TNP5_9FUNG|nr:hypothetical protein DSO57_1031535 [Entomophthora muscae]
MTPSLTLQPDRPQESVAADESTSTHIFGVIFYGTCQWTLGSPGKIVILYCKVSPNLVVGPPCQADRPQVLRNPPQAGSLTQPEIGLMPDQAMDGCQISLVLAGAGTLSNLCRSYSFLCMQSS